MESGDCRTSASVDAAAGTLNATVVASKAFAITGVVPKTVVAGGTPCTANVPDTFTGYLDPGNYELFIGLTAPSNARKTAELTYPR